MISQKSNLDEYLNTYSLRSELIGYYYNKNPISNLIISLNDIGYIFSIEEFNNFIKQATYKKSKCYLLSHSYKEEENKLKNKVIKIIFDKFNPNDKQFKSLFACYKKAHNPSYYWIDVLVERKFDFNEFQKQQLIQIGYDMNKFFQNFQITLDKLKDIIEAIVNGKSHFDILQNIIKINEFDYPDGFINYILNLFKDKPVDFIDKHLLKFLNTFIDQCKPNFSTNEILLQMIPSKYIGNDFYYLLFNNGLTPSNELINLFSNYESTFELVFNSIKYGFVLTVDMLNNMLKKTTHFSGPLLMKNYCRIHSTEKINDFFQELGFSEILINECLDKNILNLYKFFLKIGITPNNETLEIASYYKYEFIFDSCTSDFKLIPDKNILDKSLQYFCSANDNFSIISKILCYKIIPDKKSFDMLIRNPKCNYKIIELLIKFGLNLTFGNVTTSLKYGFTISNLERFNIPYDENLYFWCHVYNFFPEAYMKKFQIDDKILELRSLCGDKQTSVLKLSQFIEKHKSKLDGYCFESACKNNKELANYMLHTLNCKPTINTFYWLNYRKMIVSEIMENLSILENLLEINNINNEYLSKHL